MTRLAPTAFWLVCASFAAFAQSGQKPAAGPIVNQKPLVMQIEQIASTGTTNVFGDPGKPGTYVVRTYLAPNAKIRPRFYNQDRWITVLKGTWWVGEGDMYETSELVPIREGGFMYQPANLKTYEMAGGTGVILQITGTGPVASTHAEVDAAGMAVPIGGPYPEEMPAEGGVGRYRRGRRGQPPPAAQPNPQQPQQQQQPQQ